MNNSRQESFLMVMVQFSFNSQPPTKRTAIYIRTDISYSVSSFNSQPPTKGTAISIPSPSSSGSISFNSQPPTKGTAIRMMLYIRMMFTPFQFSAPNKGDCNIYNLELSIFNLVSILSPQQRGLQWKVISLK